jgi:threonine/homoserine/homoserine lactone efflux protein
MPLDLLMALAGYVTAMSITPGPNNVMLLTSGVNFGFRRTIPHIAGIAIGVLAVLALVGVGLGHLLVANPTIYTALKIASVIYMAWLAWRIATSAPPVAAETEPHARPLSALEAALFQWVNPKAWAMVVTAATAFTVPDNYVQSLLLMGLVFTAVNLPSAAIWAAAGTVLRRLLENPRTIRTFNIVMALFLVASSIPIVWDLVKSLS